VTRAFDLVFRAPRVVTAAGEVSGCVARGYDADFCVPAPDEAFVVDAGRLHHRHPVTPYAGRPLAGVVRGTWLRGRQVTGSERRGALLTRGNA
jgi:allantoinase